jgi:hypothetical protein
MRTVLGVGVARSCNSVRKLCTGWPSGVRFARLALFPAAVETPALATGETRIRLIDYSAQHGGLHQLFDGCQRVSDHRGIMAIGIVNAGRNPHFFGGMRIGADD